MFDTSYVSHGIIDNCYKMNKHSSQHIITVVIGYNHKSSVVLNTPKTVFNGCTQSSLIL